MMFQSLRSLAIAGLLVAAATSAVDAQSHPVIQPSPENVILPDEQESVPMLDFGGRPVVQVMINGKGPYQFIFDTGAVLIAIDTSLAAELSLEDDDTPTIDEFRVGKVVVRQAQAFVSPISQLLGKGDVPRGVLSASYFPGGVVTFDYAGKRILFRKGALPAANKKNIFDYDPGDLPSLPVKVGDREIVVHLDTGAPFALAVPTKYMKELPLAGPAVQKGQAKTTSGVTPMFVAPLKAEISIGDFKLSTHEIRFTDVVPYAAVEAKGQVGNEGLREFVLTLDSGNHRIGLAKN